MTTRREDDEESDVTAQREGASTMIGRAVQEGPPDLGPAAEMSTTELVEAVMQQVRQLARGQLTLAKTDLRADLLADITAAKGLGIAAVVVFAAANLLLITGVVALGLVMPEWLAGLIVSGVLIAAAAVVGTIAWRKRVRRPLQRNRRAIQEDIQWTYERLV